MSNLKLTIATGNYDRLRPLIDGSVTAEGIDLDYKVMFAADIFQRMMKNREFDCCELGLTFYLRSLELEDAPFIAIPVFPIRFFRHAAIFVNTASGIRRPEDLAGKRLGEMFCYGTDIGVWAKGILRDEHGLKLEKSPHYVGGVDHFVPKWEWQPRNPPPGTDVHQLGPGETLDALIEAGEIDALFSAIMPPSFLKGSSRVRRLYEDYEAVERDYFSRTGLFPIMHTFVIRKDVYARAPWAALSLYQAFEEAKAQAWRQYRHGDAFMHNAFMIPWLTPLIEQNRALMGEDHWPYGMAPNRNTLDAFLRYHHEQGVSTRRYTPEEIFAPETVG